MSHVTRDEPVRENVKYGQKVVVCDYPIYDVGIGRMVRVTLSNSVLLQRKNKRRVQRTLLEFVPLLLCNQHHYPIHQIIRWLVTQESTK